MIPLEFVFNAVDGSGDDAVEATRVFHDVVLNDGLAGTVFVLGAFGVTPPDECCISAAFSADDSSAEGIVAVFDVIAVYVGGDDAVV